MLGWNQSTHREHVSNGIRHVAEDNPRTSQVSAQRQKRKKPDTSYLLGVPKINNKVLHSESVDDADCIIAELVRDGSFAKLVRENAKNKDI